MKLYLSIFRMQFLNRLQYRAVLAAAAVTRILWALMEIFAFTAVYRSGGELPMEFSQTVNYVWMQQTLLILFSVVSGDGEIFASIRSGSISYELVRPVSLYWRWFSQAAANRTSLTVLNGIPALLLAFFLPKPYGLSLPASPWQVLLFLVSAALALGVVCLLYTSRCV